MLIIKKSNVKRDIRRIFVKFQGVYQLDIFNFDIFNFQFKFYFIYAFFIFYLNLKTPSKTLVFTIKNEFKLKLYSIIFISKKLNKSLSKLSFFKN